MQPQGCVKIPHCRDLLYLLQWFYMASLELLAFFLSSLTALVLIYFKVSTTIFQQIVAVLLLILIVISRRTLFTKFRIAFLTLSSLLVQLLIISSGGFYSPFLILVHLYTLGASFLLKIGSAISFLVFSVLVLIASTFLNQTFLSEFKKDPGSVILYLVSFIVIIPLAQFLMTTYRLKDTLSKLLTEHIEIGEKREQSILQSLNELVLVTDIDSKIISSNDAVEKSLKVPGTIVGSNLLNVVRLKDQNGDEATLESLSVNKVLENRATHFVEGFYLETRASKSLKVSVQIRPVTNLTGEINQIAFVITDARASLKQTHSELEKAKQRHSSILQNLMQAIESAQLPVIKTQSILLAKAEEDILLTQELEDHPFKKTLSYQDLAEVCQQVVEKKQAFTRALKVKLQFSLPKEEVQEAAYLSLKASNVSPKVLYPSDFSVPIDSQWLKIMLEKLIDIAALLVAGGQNSGISLSLGKLDGQTIELSLACTPAQISQVESQELFKEYYGSLAQTNLRFGSGLEGSIAKTLSIELNLPIRVETAPKSLAFKVNLIKEPEGV